MVWVASPNVRSTVFVSYSKHPHFVRRAPWQPHAAGSRRCLTRTKFARLSHEGRYPSIRSEAPRSVNIRQQQVDRPKHAYFSTHPPTSPSRHTPRRQQDKHPQNTPDPKILGEYNSAKPSWANLPRANVAEDPRMSLCDFAELAHAPILPKKGPLVGAGQSPAFSNAPIPPKTSNRRNSHEQQCQDQAQFCILPR